jgi:hypothetical protein
MSEGKMTKQNIFDAKEFCLRLLTAETEEEVVEILKRYGFWDDRSVWKPYGDIQNNRSIVSNQQSSAVAALVEKLVNSIDAVLTAECYRRGVDPKSSSAPKSMRDAAELYFDIKDGRIQSLDASERTHLAERIQLVACGTKENPAYIIVDDGEGQSPDQFPDTFLSLVRENKIRIPFVQGKFNMGGTGVLQFAGENSFQLIISRRQPDAPTDSGDKDKWGFTLVRRLYPDVDHPQSMYVYLAPQGKILRFEAESLPLRPGRFPNAYENELTAGTCIKVWNYKMQKGLKTIATLDLRYELERFLLEPVLPIRICERRSYKANYYDTTMSGLNAVLADKQENVEFSDTSPLKVHDVGNVQIRVVVIKEMEDTDKAARYPAGLFFVVNGQLQGEESAHFISRKTSFAYLANSMIVVVDCTNLPDILRENLFMASRDRMRQIDEKSAIDDAVIEYIKEHPAIRQLNAVRRQKRLESSLSKEETAKIFQSLVKSDPTLAHLFGKGDLIRIPGKDISEKEPFVGQKFPTYFRIRNEPKNGLIKHCPKNRQCRIEFETDAANGYFDRIDDPGHLECRGTPEKLYQNLSDGKATLKFGLPQGASEGDEYKVVVEVQDVSRVAPFKSEFRIHVDADAAEPIPSPSKLPGGASFAGFPNIREVYRNTWTIENFDEISALQIKPGGDDGNELDIAVNMDNIYLKNEIAKRKNFDAKLLGYWFKIGLVLLALGMINAEKRRNQNHNHDGNQNDEGEDIYERISRASEGIAVTIIPVISHMSKKQSTDDE